MLRAYLAHRVRDWSTADEIAQETLMIAWRERQGMHADADAGAWLRGIARNLVLKEAARARRFVPLLEESVERAWAAAAPAEEAAWSAMKEELAACRERLTPHLRRLIELRYDANLSCAEVAARAGISLAAAKVGLLRAREALAECVRRKMRDPA
jgi:RNA polymerase sigma-70 factor (ECF subfamily)